MQHLTPAILRDITEGDFVGDLPDREITAITTDSRAIEPGCLFAAIPGARVDGHDFIAQAAEKGAACVLCNRFIGADVAQIRVPDTQAALRQIAAFYRSQFDFPFIGVTGSVGKTTAKEMIWSVLSVRFDTLKTEKNFNNELGVPLTLFRLRSNHEAAVVEMGISHFGEMTRLADMVHPQIGVFTLIGDAHLEFLGDRRGVLQAKTEMVQEMPENGVILANGDDTLLCKHDFGRTTVLFGLGENCQVRAIDVKHEGLTGMSCTILAGERAIPVHIPAPGQHMVYAALMGAAVGLELGLTDEEIQRGIAAYEPVGSRGRVIQAPNCTILDDCYNANPTSMKNALDNLAALPGRHVAILGDMLELGPDGPALHRQMGEYAVQTGAELLCCGELSKTMGGQWFDTVSALIQALPAMIQPQDVVLVKASHGMAFAQIVEALSELHL